MALRARHRYRRAQALIAREFCYSASSRRFVGAGNYYYCVSVLAAGSSSWPLVARALCKDATDGRREANCRRWSSLSGSSFFAFAFAADDDDADESAALATSNEYITHAQTDRLMDQARDTGLSCATAAVCGALASFAFASRGPDSGHAPEQ